MVGATALASGELQKNIDLLMNADITGYAQKRAVMQLETYKGTLKQTRTAYQEMILSIDDGTGAFAKSLTTLNKVVGSMFLILSGSNNANEALKKMDATIVATAQNWLGWVKVIAIILSLLLTMSILIKTWAILVGIAQVAMASYNIVLGISIALGWGNIYSLRASAFAMGAYKTVVWLAEAAQKALNFTMKASPFIIVALGILGLIDAYKDLSKAVDKANNKMAEKEEKEKGRYIQYEGGFGTKVMKFVPDTQNIDSVLQSYRARGLKAEIMDKHLQKIDSARNIDAELKGLGPELDSMLNKKPVIKPIASKDTSESKNENQNQAPFQFGKLLIELMNNSGTGIRTQMDSTNVQPVISSSMGY